LPRNILIESAALRRKQDHTFTGMPGPAAIRPDRFNRFEDRLGFQNHSLTAAERPVVDSLVTILSPVSQIVEANFDQPRPEGPLDHAVLEWSAEKIREDRQHVEGHNPYFYRSMRPSGSSTRMTFRATSISLQIDFANGTRIFRPPSNST